MAEKVKSTKKETSTKTKEVSANEAKRKKTSTVAKKTNSTVKDTKKVKKESSEASAMPVKNSSTERVDEKKQPAKENSGTKQSVKSTQSKTDEKIKKQKVEPAKKAESTNVTKEEHKVEKEVATEKPTVAKKAAKKTTTAKKTTKKATTAKKTTKKATTKATTAKKATKKASATKKTTTTKKATTSKKVEEKPVEVKKDEKALLKEKIDQYYSFSIDTCIDMARAMGINKGYEDYEDYLLEEADETKIAESVIKEANIKTDAFTFEKDGYDLDLIPILISRIAETVDMKASDFADLEKVVTDTEKLELTEDDQENNDTYNKLFDVVRKVLMISQRKHIYKLEELHDLLNIDFKPLIEKYMDVAYVILKNWQYGDVKYYEGFIYGVLSQFEELHQSLGNRAMMDVADLYIVHGDYGLGDANYNYIIRENEIKDLIYYRFAHIYEDIDRDKARAIAGESKQFVDSRFDYYEKIQKILEN